MRYWVHGILTILATIIAIVAYFFFMLFLVSAPLPGWVIQTTVVVGALAALFGPSLLMTLVPVRCPNCGGKARYRYYSWVSSFGGGRGFRMGPKFGYGCDSCGWSTYYWSKYQENWRRQRASQCSRERTAKSHS